MSEVTRCPWSLKTSLETAYHDTEWGVPQKDDRVLFEFLILEAAQAGLSWSTVLAKREGYRRCFASFDPEAVGRFTTNDVDRLMQDASIVRNRKKIECSISNARCFLDLAAKHGSFSNYIWAFVDGKPVQNNWQSIAEVPATTPLSDTISKELKRLGFKFLGSTVLYAYMQATGLVNDHLVSCFRYETVKNLS